jgi:hypothetical protein
MALPALPCEPRVGCPVYSHLNCSLPPRGRPPSHVPTAPPPRTTAAPPAPAPPHRPRPHTARSPSRPPTPTLSACTRPHACARQGARAPGHRRAACRPQHPPAVRPPPAPPHCWRPGQGASMSLHARASVPRRAHAFTLSSNSTTTRSRSARPITRQGPTTVRVVARARATGGHTPSAGLPTPSPVAARVASASAARSTRWHTAAVHVASISSASACLQKRGQGHINGGRIACARVYTRMATRPLCTCLPVCFGKVRTAA